LSPSMAVPLSVLLMTSKYMTCLHSLACGVCRGGRTHACACVCVDTHAWCRRV
jgi:hypothetical protein